MIAFQAHFDGQFIVPEHAVDLPRDRPLFVRVETSDESDLTAKNDHLSALLWIAENAVEDELPADLSVQADHYLYGTPKRV